MVQIKEGLIDVVAGVTSISEVGKEAQGLSYRGYGIEDLAQHTCFEEVAYLLIHGQLPSSPQLQAYQEKLSSLRVISPACQVVLERIPA